MDTAARVDLGHGSLGAALDVKAGAGQWPGGGGGAADGEGLGGQPRLLGQGLADEGGGGKGGKGYELAAMHGQDNHKNRQKGPGALSPAQQRAAPGGQ